MKYSIKWRYFSILTYFRWRTKNGYTIPFQRGNHQSTAKNAEALNKIIENDISKGYALPLPIDTRSLAPLGCIDQETINERGKRTTKFRMMHDQSFLGPSGHSVNERVIKDCLPNCMYSFAMSRILHYIISLRLHHPLLKIFISKFDLDSAYWRSHLSGETALESLTIHGDTLLMAWEWPSECHPARQCGAITRRP